MLSRHDVHTHRPALGQQQCLFYQYQPRHPLAQHLHSYSLCSVHCISTVHLMQSRAISAKHVKVAAAPGARLHDIWMDVWIEAALPLVAPLKVLWVEALHVHDSVVVKHANVLSLLVQLVM